MTRVPQRKQSILPICPGYTLYKRRKLKKGRTRNKGLKFLTHLAEVSHHEAALRQLLKDLKLQREETSDSKGRPRQ